MTSPQPDFKDTLPPANPSKRWYLHLADGALVILAISAILIFIYFYSLQKSYRIPATSMEPSILKGDHVITFKYIGDQKPKRGDIVIFPYPDDRHKAYLKRIVGMPGETLEIRQQQVYINNKGLEEPYAQHTEPPQAKLEFPRDDFGPIMIPDEHFFVIGDNRENSIDSRLFGPLEIKDIERKVKIIYWSWNNEENTVRWDRIGKILE